MAMAIMVLLALLHNNIRFFMKNHLRILCLLFSFKTIAQTPTPPVITATYPCSTNASTVVSKIWDKRFGGSYAEELTAVLSTSDGGYLLGGWSESGLEGDKSQATQGYSDYWVVKINSSGVKVWDKRFGGVGSEILQTIVPTNDGGYLLAGYSDSGASGDRTDATRGSWDYWVVKIDDTGTKLWDKRCGGTSQDLLYSAIATPDGGFLLGGSSAKATNTLTTFPDGDKSQATQGYTDYWVIKINSTGTKEWDKRFGGTLSDELKSLAITSDGGYLLGGYSESETGGDKTQASQGSNDYWLVKINATGTKLWDYRFGGTDSDILLDMVANTDGSFVLMGLSHSGISGNRTQTSQGTADYWLVKINSAGTKQWDYRFGGTNSDIANSIKSQSDGGYIIAGTSQSALNGDKTEASQGFADYWIVKIDDNGTKSWDKRFGGSLYEDLKKIIINADGSVLLTGLSYSDISGDKSETSQGNGDFWALKAVAACTAVAYQSEYICPNTALTLTASNCAGTVNWSNGIIGSSITILPTLSTI